MKALVPSDGVARILRSLSPQSLIDAETVFRALTGDWKKIGTRRFRFARESFDLETGEVTRIYEVELWWGRSAYFIPVTQDLAIALSKNFCSIASRTAGRGVRSGFNVTECGR